MPGTGPQTGSLGAAGTSARATSDNHKDCGLF